MLARRRVVDSNAPILTCRQDVLLTLVRFHVVKSGFADNVVTPGKLDLTASVGLLIRRPETVVEHKAEGQT